MTERPGRSAGRPPLAPGERRVRVDLRLPPETVAALDALALDAGETRTGMVERLVAQARRRKGRKTK